MDEENRNSPNWYEPKVFAPESYLSCAAIKGRESRIGVSAVLYQHLSLQGADDCAEKILSVMRFEVGGHVERPIIIKSDSLRRP